MVTLQNMIFSDNVNEETNDLVHLISGDNNSELPSDSIPKELPILPIKNTVLFPGVLMPITVSRQKSIELVKKSYNKERIIGVVAQKNEKSEDPKFKDIYQVGTIAKILKMFILPDGNTTIIIQGKNRFEITEKISEQPQLVAQFVLLNETYKKLNQEKSKAIFQSIKEAAKKILNLNTEIPKEAQAALENIDNETLLIHFLSSNVNAEVADKQRLLEKNDLLERAQMLLKLMLKDIQLLELKREIHNKVHSDIDQQQRDFYLRQQMRVLQDELGYDGADQEIATLRERGNKKKWPDFAKEHFEKEVGKLERMNPSSSEFPLTLNYVELLVELPWQHATKDNFDLKRAKKILDNDHFGLEKIKERIIEFLAVRKLKNDMKGPILCLYGPPGVGKTSLGKSIAHALNRKYVRLSLGGVHDEAEIRGHRKTYVGAMPGKIIQYIKRAGSSNPVFILDEIDKVNSDFRGDPSSALLEVLDPEQNKNFKDNYLEIDYDLSKVLFIATANQLDTIQPALRDRMEIINVTGYTLEEKTEIAKKYLIPKLKKEHGLKSSQFQINKNSIEKVINEYTRESGVRNLERKLGSLVRFTAKSIVLEEDFPSQISNTEVKKVLGPAIFDKELYEGNELSGVVTGLAWTPVGGDILFIEASLNKGKGALTLSGQLGDVMRESAKAALSYLKANAEDLGIDFRIFKQYDLHIHVPAGAVPKDGPSAGITLLTALASVFTQRKVKNKLAMTGEITLRGKVLPVGGIKEKLLAARRAGIVDVIMCKRNEKDLEEIDNKYLKGLKIHFVEYVSEVLEIALLKQKVKNPIQFSFEQENIKI